MNTIFNDIISTPNQVRKFYLLDYFYILLKSVKQHSNQPDIFNSFKQLKQTYLLGESKYKKLTIDDEENLTEKQLVKFKYTFDQVIIESIDYELIIKKDPIYIHPINSRLTAKIKREEELKKQIFLTEKGELALIEYEKSRINFNFYMLKLMEEKHKSFFELINLCYSDKTLKNGLLIFPIYSGLKLGFDKSSFTTNKQVYDYSEKLAAQLEIDIRTYTNKQVSLKNEEKTLINKLRSDKILGEKQSDTFNPQYYNATLSRFRKYWLNYFLNTIYNYRFNFEVFNIWIERAKQVGVLYTSEFYPNFSGRIVYPTAIITNNTSNQDFKEVFKYNNGKKLYIHYPTWNNEFQHKFVKTLLDEYFIIQKTRLTHFINLSDLKERVCFKLRIPNFVFDEFLEKAYTLNLQGKLPIQISLEADKLPHETNAMYLKREPISVNGKLKNIIAINYHR